MADNIFKTPLVGTLNRFAERKILDAISLQGKALPCRVVAVQGAIVTVAFEVTDPVLTFPQVTVPHFGPQYIRYPTQIGDLGVVFPADARLGGVSGLGSGLADLTPPANLGALVFFPIGNANWEAVSTNYLVMYGPGGVIIRDSANMCSIVVAADGTITITGNIAVTGNITATGSIVAGQGTGDQVGLQSHEHVNGGGTGNSGPPAAGT